MATLREVCEQLERDGKRISGGLGGWYRPLNFLAKHQCYAKAEQRAEIRAARWLCIWNIGTPSDGTRADGYWVRIGTVVDAPRRRVSSRPKDMQRRKLYRAEDSVALGKALPELEDIVQYLAWLQGRRWWRWSKRPIQVLDGRGRRRAGGGGWAIHMPRWSRHERHVLHEVAHNLGGIGHGREYARIYLELVSHAMGPEHGAMLRSAFRREHVHWRKKRQLSAQQMAALRARGRALAAAARKRDAEPGGEA